MEVEAMAAAAYAWAKERRDYDALVLAEHVYIMARRKTTELIEPYIARGGSGSNQHESKGNEYMTLADYGFTKMQWYRRVRELEVPPERVDEYFDECIAKGWEPSLFGMLKYKQDAPPAVTHEDWCASLKPCDCKP